MKSKSRLTKYLYKNRSSLIVYFSLRSLVVLSLIRELSRDDYHSVFMCVLALISLILPSILSHKLELKLPSTLEVIILLFIFAAEILGEINNFYVRVPHWDTMLHTINGFLCAAVGFALVDLLNRNERFSVQLSPLFLAIVAFCFSMAVGVLWEFFEYSADFLLGMDMQKDTIIHELASVSLDPTNSNNVVTIKGITDVIVVANGEEISLGLGGYLDVGILDTMKDLWVNFIGAVIFSIIGYIYIKNRGKGWFAPRFIPKVLRDELA